jgi:cytochrome c oxidase subunit II
MAAIKNLQSPAQRRTLMAVTACLCLALLSNAAMAGSPEPWGMWLIPAASPVREMMDHFHIYYLVPMMFGVSALVLGLLTYAILRFNRRANPQPAKFAHNVTIEVLWTAIPILILVIIGFPSMKLLYYGAKAEKPDMTIKVTGHQWYWSYEYPDHGNFGFDARPIWESAATTKEQSDKLIAESSGSWLIPTPQPLRLLETDNRVVIPVGATVRVFVTAADVIHSWLLPALGVQKSAIPGRLNETWLKADREGIYYGQCNKICGVGHGYMPIVVEAVTPERFDAWVKTKQPVTQ